MFFLGPTSEGRRSAKPTHAQTWKPEPRRHNVLKNTFARKGGRSRESRRDCLEPARVSGQTPVMPNTCCSPHRLPERRLLRGTMALRGVSRRGSPKQRLMYVPAFIVLRGAGRRTWPAWGQTSKKTCLAEHTPAPHYGDARAQPAQRGMWGGGFASVGEPVVFLLGEGGSCFTAYPCA